MNISNKLWTEFYRPKTVDEYVFTDDKVREQVKVWIEQKNIPHLLLYGPAGTGKTTLAKVLVNQLEIDPYDFLQVNASRDNGVDFLKSKIEGFVSTIPFGDLKIVLLDEADYLSQPAQGILRGLLETYAETARFILTCNFHHKIIPPLKSRCTELHIDKTDQTEFTHRAATILVSENVDFDLDTLDTYVKATYPDLRKCLNLLQPNSVTGKLQLMGNTQNNTQDYRLEMVDLFKNKKFKQARQLLCSQVRPEEMEELFRWAYDNLDIWSSTEQGQDEAILVIRKGLVNHSMVADPEINLSATLIELAQIDK
jgi:DNA polymerase III delta prime subunit